MKRIDVESARKAWSMIETIANANTAPVSESFVTRAELAQMLRAELKKLGISNRIVSVTYPKNAYCVNVEVIDTTYDGLAGDEFWAVMDARSAAKRALYGMIERMFPDNGPRYGEGGIYSDAFYASYSVG